MKRVLVVEDNKANMHLFRFLLKKHGFEVIEAWNGVEGVESAIREKPDLVLLDIQLPDINGLEVMKRIRASEADGNIPIIALTSYAMVGDKEKLLAAGFNGYMAKPIDVKTFIVEVEKYS
jgi:CheY-like chemotaxis protein